MRVLRADGRCIGPLLAFLAAAVLVVSAEEDWQPQRFTGDDVDSFFERTASNRRVLLIGPATRREDNVVAASVRRPSEQNRPQPLASPFPQHLRPIVLIKNKGHPPPPTDNRPVAEEVNEQPPFTNTGLFHVQPDVREFQQEQLQQEDFPDRNRFFSQDARTRQQEFERPQQPTRFNQEVPVESNSGFRGSQRSQNFQREEEGSRGNREQQFRSFPSTSNRNQFLDPPTHDPRPSMIPMPPTTFDPQVDLRSNSRPQQTPRTHLQEINSGRLPPTDQSRGRFRFTEEDALPRNPLRQTQRPAPPPTTQAANSHPPTVSKDLDEFFGNQNLVPTTPAVTPGKSQTWPSAAFPPTTSRPRAPFLPASKAVSPALTVESRFPQTARPQSNLDDDHRFGAVEEDEDQPEGEDGGDIAQSPNRFKGLTGINPQFVDFSTLTTKTARRPSSTPAPTIRVNPTPKTRTVIPSPPSKRPTQSVRTSAPSLPQRVTATFRDSITPPSNRGPLRSTFRPRTTTEAIEPIDHIIQFKDIPRTGTRSSVRKTSVRKTLIRNSSPATKNAVSVGRASSTAAPSRQLNRFNNQNPNTRHPTSSMTRDDEIFSKEEDPNGSNFPIQLDPSRSRVFIPPRTAGRGASQLSNTLSPLSPDGAVPVSQEDDEEYDDGEEEESTTALTTPRSLPVTARATWRAATRPTTRPRTLNSGSRTTQLVARQRPLVASTLRNQGRFMQRPPSTTLDYLDIQPAPEVDNFQEDPSPPSNFRKPRPHLPRAQTQATHPTVGEEDFPDSNAYDESLEDSDEEYEDFSTTPATTFRPTRPKRPTRRRPSISSTTQRPKVRVSTKSSMGRVETKSSSSSTSRNGKTKCDPRYCQLPHCSCGGQTIPGGFVAEDIPQIVLLTFDDAVNDLNWPLYQTLFFQDRTNPNGCPILTTLYVSHEWTDYGKVQSMYAAGHEIASHSISHGDGAAYSKQKWHDEIYGQKEILSRYGGVKMEDIRGMRAPFLQIGGNKMFGMLHEDNFTYDSSVTVLENNPPVWPYTFDYGMPHSCAIPPCPTGQFPGLWEIPMVSLTDTNGGRCSMADSCSYDTTSDGVYKMLMKNFDRHYNSNRAPLGLYYHSSWFLIPHRKEGFIKFLEEVMQKDDVYFITAYQLIEWMRNPTPLSRIKDFGPWQCYKNDRPEACRRSRECNIPFRGDTRVFRTCGECPSIYPWVGKTNV